MKKYKYTGNLPFAATLQWNDEKGKPVKRDVQLAKDEIADLPEDLATVKWMAASGLLVEAEQVKKTTSNK